jgi:16S rRNA (cytosine1402-N4)-methyltransferase
MHKPVLVKEVLDHLLTPSARVIFDATVGTGGHSEAIVADARYRGNLICSDRDQDALEIAENRLDRYRDRITFVHLRFSGIGDYLRQSSVDQVSGFLFDLGLCALHLESKERGFSFQLDGPLDMRMDRSQSKTALEVVNRYPAAQLADILRRFGQEKLAGVIARAIARTREKAAIRTTFELRRAIEPVLDPKHRIKSLARVFQAVRIEVNDELGELKSGLEQAISHLAPGGRLAVISYHSLEHRLIREKMRRESRECVCPPEFPICTCGVRAKLRLVTAKPILPSAAEILENSQSRSAKLWVAEKLAGPEDRSS